MAPPRAAAVGLKTLLGAAVIAAGALHIGQGLAIHAKAVLAQVLLERAWSRSLDGGGSSKPWAWADTWPVARLKVPDHGIDQVVLEGAGGNVLAFAPGRVNGSVLPGTRGRIVISGHRDTHFRFLENVVPGQRLMLQAADGSVRRFRVAGTRVADTRARNGDMLYPPGDGLTLITCYPFGAVRPGGPLRYLVDAEPA